VNAENKRDTINSPRIVLGFLPLNKHRDVYYAVRINIRYFIVSK
jgi:hypothetical protein